MITIWRFRDGKRGHENQALGLIEALCRLDACQIQTLHVCKGWPHVFSWLLGSYSPGKNLTRPDLIVGAGHATHWPMLAARRAYGGKIAVLMKPSLPLSWFDWVIAPAHDALPEGASTLSTQGPINRIRPGTAQDPRQGLMLIGGPSAEYGWNETALLKQIHLIALQQPDVTWHLTTSRRTPAGFLDNLARLGLGNVKAFAHDQVSADWLPAQLAQAAQAWVTPDSASMVYEALSSGAAVGCFELPYARPGRVARGLEKLARERRLTAFPEWERSGKLIPNDHPLTEAERCARQLLQCLKPAN
jgi:mitochondrial fission protein ELM1